MATNIEFSTHPIKFNFITIGESTVGKTALIQCYSGIKLKQTNLHVATVGVDYKVKRITVENKSIVLQIWDTAGQERFKTLTPMYFKRCQGFILVYDITKIETFNKIQYWIDEIYKEVNKEEVAIILIGNKRDLEDQRQVSTEQGQELAKELDIKFFETSAYENTNVKEAFKYLSKKLLRIKEGKPISNDWSMLSATSETKARPKEKDWEGKSKCCI